MLKAFIGCAPWHKDLVTAGQFPLCSGHLLDTGQFATVQWLQWWPWVVSALDNVWTLLHHDTSRRLLAQLDRSRAHFIGGYKYLQVSTNIYKHLKISTNNNKYLQMGSKIHFTLLLALHQQPGNGRKRLGLAFRDNKMDCYWFFSLLWAKRRKWSTL